MGWRAHLSSRGPLIRRKGQIQGSKRAGEAEAVEKTSRLNPAERSDGNMQPEVGLEPHGAGCCGNISPVSHLYAQKLHFVPSLIALGEAAL